MYLLKTLGQIIIFKFIAAITMVWEPNVVKVYYMYNQNTFDMKYIVCHNMEVFNTTLSTCTRCFKGNGHSFVFSSKFYYL